MTHGVRVECATCGWWNESFDVARVLHSGVVHTTMLKPGHVLLDETPNDYSDPPTFYADVAFRVALRNATQRSWESLSQPERQQAGYDGGFLDGFNAGWTAAVHQTIQSKMRRTRTPATANQSHNALVLGKDD